MVTIAGSALSTTTAVSFAGVQAAAFNVVNDTSITAVVPMLSNAGTINVIVSAAGGTSAASVGSQFTYVPRPVLSGISPTSGDFGTLVTLTGTYLTTVTGVSFGGVAASSAVVLSDTVITAMVPPGAQSGVVTVATVGGATSSAQLFTVLPSPPTITQATQSASTVSGGGTVNFAVTALDVNIPAQALTTSWTASDGSPLSGTGSTFSWTAESCLANPAGTIITATVSNTSGLSASKTFSVQPAVDAACGWNAEQVLSHDLADTTFTADGNPIVAVDGFGNAEVLFQSGTSNPDGQLVGGQVFARRYQRATSTWGPLSELPIPQGQPFRFAMTQQGNGLVVFEGTDGNMHALWFVNGTWGTDQILPVAQGDQSLQSLSIDEQGDVAMTYLNPTSGASSTIGCAVYDASSGQWGEEKGLYTGPGDGFTSLSGVRRQGATLNALAVIGYLSSNLGYAFVASWGSLAVGSGAVPVFGAATLITQGPGAEPQLVLSSLAAALVWYDYDSAGYSVNQALISVAPLGGVFTAPEQLDDFVPGRTAWTPQVAANADGSFLAVSGSRRHRCWRPALGPLGRRGRDPSSVVGIFARVQRPLAISAGSGRWARRRQGGLAARRGQRRRGDLERNVHQWSVDAPTATPDQRCSLQSGEPDHRRRCQWGRARGVDDRHFSSQLPESV